MKILNVAEKPSVARGISQIMSRGSSRNRRGFSPHNPIYTFTYSGQIRGNGHFGPINRCEMIFTSVAGHMMELDFDGSMRAWTIPSAIKCFDADVVKTVSERSEALAKTLKREIRQCTALILWLDCDREGENIAMEVVEVCRKVKANVVVKRARFSAVIQREIDNALCNLVDVDIKQSEAVNARTEIDLRLGAAFTRFLTLHLRSRFGDFNDKSIVSFGPCQCPTLGFVVERKKRIDAFVRESFWFIEVSHRREDSSATFKWKRGRLFDHLACFVIYELCTEHPIAVVKSVRGTRKTKRKPFPLETVELQKIASRYLRFSSDKTMKIAERLYQGGLLSYPRTETNKFPDGFDLRKIVREQSQGNKPWCEHARQLDQDGKFRNPRNGNKDDKAHPPIHPTKFAQDSNFQNADEAKLYELVVRHFLACCSDDAIGQQTTITIEIASEIFTAWGLMVLEKNFLEVYKYVKWSGKTLPRFTEGDTFRPTSMMMRKGQTAPPELLSEVELISLMNKTGIGTDATIAQHILTIQTRNYAKRVRGNLFEPSPLGMALCEAFAAMGSRDLAKPYLRANMERSCTDICNGTKSRADVVHTTLTQMRQVFIEMKRNANILTTAFARWLNMTPSATPIINRPRPPSNPRTVRRQLSRCGKCGQMMALVSAASHNSSSSSSATNNRKMHFLRCSSPQCTDSSSGQATFFKLPSSGKIFKSNQHTCPLCNYQVVDVQKSNTSRPYQICPQCFNFPPADIVSDIENLPTRMPCFSCPAVSRCALACGSSTSNPEVSPCPTCLTSSLVLRSSSSKSGQNRVVKTFRLSCDNCKHVVWLPRITKNVTVSQQTCRQCSSARRKAYMLNLEFRRHEHPPSLAPQVTMCVASDKCCPSLSNLGHKVKKGIIPSSQSRSRSSNSSYGVMTGIRSVSSSSSSSSSMSSSKRPSVLRPQKKKRARTSQGSNSNSRLSNNKTISPNCYCGTPSVSFTVRAQTKNHGRNFFKCQKRIDGCNFFKFEDEL